MNTYDMRVKNRKKENSEDADEYGIHVITSEVIKNIPCIDVTNDPGVNIIIRSCHQKIMEASKYRKDNHQYDEVGMLVELVYPYKNSEIILGKYNPKRGCSSVSTQDPIYIKYIAEHKKNQLMFMHNHPNNSSFSYGDFMNFINTQQLQIITAVRNSGGIYAMWKDPCYDKSLINEHLLNVKKEFYKKHGTLTEQDARRIENEEFRSIIKSPEKFNLHIRFSPQRRNER